MKQLSLGLLVLGTVMLAACAPTTATPGPAPQPSPVVAPETPAPVTGSLNWVAAAKRGGRVEIPAGTYVLDAPLELSGDVELLGAGSSRTIIQASFGEFMLRYSGGGRLLIEGISLEYTGTAHSDLLRITDGQFSISDSRFVGAVHNDTESIGGDGIWLLNNARGTIQNSVFDGNELNGVDVTDNVQVDLLGNTFKDNGVGIAYWDTAGGRAASNLVSTSILSGIQVAGTAAPRLEGNDLRRNGGSGILYVDSASGEAKNNYSENNGGDGIVVEDSARPTLSGNTLKDNSGFGLYVGTDARPKVDSNTFSGNLEGESSGLHLAAPAPIAAPATPTPAPEPNTQPEPTDYLSAADASLPASVFLESYTQDTITLGELQTSLTELFALLGEDVNGLVYESFATPDNPFNGMPLVFFPVLIGDAALTSFFIQAGFDPNTQAIVYDYEENLLTAAIFNDFPEVVRVLLDANADPQRPVSDSSAYEQAYLQGGEVWKVMEAATAVAAPSTAPSSAVQSVDSEEVSLAILLAMLHETDTSGAPAAQAVLTALDENPALDVNTLTVPLGSQLTIGDVTVDGWPLIVYALALGEDLLVETLLATGTNPDMTFRPFNDDYQVSLLGIAALFETVSGIKALLAYGANANLPGDSDGALPVDLTENAEIRALLQNAQASR